MPTRPTATPSARSRSTETATANTYQLRNIATGQLTPNITTNALITWVLNKSGVAYNYIAAPNGTVQSVANNRMDLWVGTTLSTGFDEMAITTSTASLTDLKFFWGSTSATMVFDNFRITSPTLLNPQRDDRGQRNGDQEPEPDRLRQRRGGAAHRHAGWPAGTLVGWSGDASGGTSPTSVTMDSTRTSRRPSRSTRTRSPPLPDANGAIVRNPTRRPTTIPRPLR